MPIYEYECEQCHKITEAWQHLSDAPLSTCPECQGTLQKLISQSSFQLKGGGWYADGYCSSGTCGTSSTPDKSDKKTSDSTSTSTSSSCPNSKADAKACCACNSST